MRRTAPAAAALALLLSAPALADHGIAGHGAGGMNVMSPDSLPKGQFAGSLGLSLLLPEWRSNAELAALAGAHIHGHSDDYKLLAVPMLAYGLTDRVTLIALLPYVRRNDIRAGHHAHSGGEALNTVERIGTVSGIGDLRLMAHARLFDWHGGSTAAMVGVKAPSGSTGKASRDGERLEVEHQPGSGSWDPMLGVSIGVGEGAWRLTASATREWAGKSPLDTRLGDRTLAGVAVAFTPGAAGHHDDEGEAPHHHRRWSLFVESTYEAEGKMRIAGEVEADSGSKAVWLSPGVKFEAADGWSWGASAGLPLWQDVGLSHPRSKLRLTTSVGRSF